MDLGRNIKYDGRIFAAATNSPNDDVGSGTAFRYHEKDAVVWAEYCGGDILKGVLLGKKGEDGSLDIRYVHLTRVW